MVIPSLLRAAATWFAAWMLMIAVGIVHGDWIPALPTIGYGTSLILTAIAVGTHYVIDLVNFTATYVSREASKRRADR